MSPESAARKLAAAAGGLVVVGTVGCTAVTILAGIALAVTGGSIGYLGTESTIGALAVSTTVSLLVGLYAYRRS